MLIAFVTIHAESVATVPVVLVNKRLAGLNYTDTSTRTAHTAGTSRKPACSHSFPAIIRIDSDV